MVVVWSLPNTYVKFQFEIEQLIVKVSGHITAA